LSTAQRALLALLAVVEEPPRAELRPSRTLEPHQAHQDREAPADTEPMNIVARLVDSAIVAARAPCKVKCSVVTNATAAGRGSAPSAAAFAIASLLVGTTILRATVRARLAQQE
jgi:hypothetical protein